MTPADMNAEDSTPATVPAPDARSAAAPSTPLWRGFTAALALVVAAEAVTIGFLVARSSDAERRADDAEARVAALERETATLRDPARAPAVRETAPTVVVSPGLEGRTDRASSALAPSGPPTAPANPTSLPAPRFPLAGFEEALGEVNWDVVGANLVEMARHLPRLADAALGREDLAPETVGRIQQLNAPLTTAGLRFGRRAGSSDSGGALTHPAFASNSIAAGLQAAGKPLSPGQTAQLQEIGVRFTDEETRRQAAYDARTFALRSSWTRPSSATGSSTPPSPC